MKRTLLTVFLMLSFIPFVYAKTYVIVDKTTNEIKSISPEDDAQLTNPDWQKIILPDNYRDIYENMQHQPTYYLYKNNRFVENIKKISDEENTKMQAQEKFNLKKQAKEEALKKLKEICNLTDNEIEALKN